MMNHDATHCSDYRPTCPKCCYRVRLTLDLESRWEEFVGLPLSWSHFEGTEECPKEKAKVKE